MLHYDGTTWHDVLVRDSRGYSGVWGAWPSDVYAVGSYGAIVHYDGATWDQELSEWGGSLHGVWGTGPFQMFAVGPEVLRRKR